MRRTQITEEDQDRYGKLFDKIWESDLKAIEEMTVGQPVGKQLHLMVKIDLSNPFMLARDAATLKKMYEIAFKQYTPLKDDEDASAGKKVSINNFDLSKLASIRPGDYLNKAGKKKGTKKAPSKEDQYLVNCDVNPKESVDRNLISSIASDPKKIELFKAMFQAGGDNEKWTRQILKHGAMISAINGQNCEGVDLIIKSAESVPVPIKVEQYEGLDVAGKKSQWAIEHQGEHMGVIKNSPIQDAWDSKQYNVMRHLLENYTAKGYQHKDSGWIFLLQWDQIGHKIMANFGNISCSAEQIEILRILLKIDEKMKTNYLDKKFGKDESGNSLLVNTLQNGSVETFKLLLESGATLQHDEQLVHHAVNNEDIGMLQAVLEEIGDKTVRIKDSEGRTALSHACFNGDEQSVYVLLKDGRIDVNERDAEGFTALEIAARGRHQQCVALLLKKADSSVHSSENSVGMIPHDYAIQAFETAKEDEDEEKVEEKEKFEKELLYDAAVVADDLPEAAYKRHRSVNLLHIDLPVVDTEEDKKKKQKAEALRKEIKKAEEKIPEVLPEKRIFVKKEQCLKVFERFQQRERENKKAALLEAANELE